MWPPRWRAASTGIIRSPVRCRTSVGTRTAARKGRTSIFRVMCRPFECPRDCRHVEESTGADLWRSTDQYSARR